MGSRASLPETAWRRMTYVLRNGACASVAKPLSVLGRSMATYSVAKRVNNLTGSYDQPLSSSLLACIVNDYVIHQFPGACGRSLLQQGVASLSGTAWAEQARRAATAWGPVLLGARLYGVAGTSVASLSSALSTPPTFFPRPVLTTCFAALGLAIGLHKLGRFEHGQALIRAATGIMQGHPELGRKLARLTTRVMREPQNAAAADALVGFLGDHLDDLGPGARAFGQALQARDPAALEKATRLIGRGQAYERDKSEAGFAALMEGLAACVDLGWLPAGAHEARLLATDVLKTVGIGVALGAHWCVYLASGYGDEGRTSEDLLFGLVLLAAMPVIVLGVATDAQLDDTHTGGDALHATALGRKLGRALVDGFEVPPLFAFELARRGLR
jgi:hypothetical protein